MKKRVDLHNHTTRCNHASGTIDEYIQRAIELGIDIYGFSEHAPMNFDTKYRLKFEEMDIYEQEIKELKKRYKNQIDIRLGYEVDYLPNLMDKRVLNSDVDYLIGSVHFIDKWGFDNPEFIGHYKDKNIDDIWIEYFNAVSNMAKSGLFDIVGHFDLIKVFKFMPKKSIDSIAYNALKSIKQSNMVIEINTAGFRKPINELYPSQELLTIAYELGIEITFSSDAHEINQVGFEYEKALKMAKDIGYKKVIAFKNRDLESYEI